MTTPSGSRPRPDPAGAGPSAQPQGLNNARPDAVLLLGKGGYGNAPAEELERMVGSLRAWGRYPLVASAFVDQGAPSLQAVLQACADAGARRILVVPVFVPMDRSLRIWLPKIVRRWLRRREAPPIEIVLADPLGDHAALGEAVRRVAAEAEQREDIRVNASRDRGDPAWSVNPLHRRHALICMGPRCSSYGAGDLHHRLNRDLVARGLSSGPLQVRMTQTGCLYPCNLGPVMVVYPEGAWYGFLTVAAIDRIVEEHLVSGRVVERYTCPPAARPYKRSEREEAV